jgi:hypothetical protein
MSPLQNSAMAQYTKVCIAIDRMTELAQCGVKINMSFYNFLHQCKYYQERSEGDNNENN